MHWNGLRLQYALERIKKERSVWKVCAAQLKHFGFSDILNDTLGQHSKYELNRGETEHEFKNIN
jgi:hypothetical protein